MTTLEKCKKKGTDGIEREGIINPETKKCVFIDGAVGRRLLKQYEDQEKEKKQEKQDIKSETIKSETIKVENKKEEIPDIVRINLNNFIFKNT